MNLMFSYLIIASIREWTVRPNFKSPQRPMVRLLKSPFFLCIVMALVGLIIAILSRKERDIYYFFSYLGMALNGAVLLAGAGVMYLGLR